MRALGVPVWPMVKYEADDGLAAGAFRAAADSRVDQVQMLTPDKDLGQMVSGNRVVQYDRRNDLIIDEAKIIEKFGVGPASIADWLGLVGDTADGFPGLPGWGAKSAATVLAQYLHIADIPNDEEKWVADGVSVRSAAKWTATLRDQREMADLFKIIATVVTDVEDDVPIGNVDDWEWRGPSKELAAIAKQLETTDLVERAERAMIGRGIRLLCNYRLCPHRVFQCAWLDLCLVWTSFFATCQPLACPLAFSAKSCGAGLNCCDEWLRKDACLLRCVPLPLCSLHFFG